MHGEIISFYVEADGRHVVMTGSDPDDGAQVTIRVSQAELSIMAEAEPLRLPATPVQTLTPGY
jgi:hypothetical protein